MTLANKASEFSVSAKKDYVKPFSKLMKKTLRFSSLKINLQVSTVLDVE